MLSGPVRPVVGVGMCTCSKLSRQCQLVMPLNLSCLLCDHCWGHPCAIPSKHYCELQLGRHSPVQSRCSCQGRSTSKQHTALLSVCMHNSQGTQETSSLACSCRRPAFHMPHEPRWICHWAQQPGTCPCQCTGRPPLWAAAHTSSVREEAA